MADHEKKGPKKHSDASHIVKRDSKGRFTKIGGSEWVIKGDRSPPEKKDPWDPRTPERRRKE